MPSQAGRPADTEPSRRRSRPSPVPGTPRWAVAAAYLTVVSVLPSALWRTLVGLGVDLGWSAPQLELQQIPGPGTLYLLALSVLSIGGAAATLGLVYPFGEVLPAWLPVVGGRRVPTWCVVAVAGLGVVVVGAVVGQSILRWDQVSGFADRPDSGWARLMVACYLPAALWPPLLAATAVAYRRRRKQSPPRVGDPCASPPGT